jgi:3-oxoacyl-[acyl-carrier-protein] synthase III
MIGISEIATYIPPGRESNLDKLEKFGITAGFIEEKIGVNTVARKDAGQETSDLCVAAARRLEEKTPGALESVDFVLTCTQNPDGRGLPHVSAILHGKLGLDRRCAAFDISLGCSGFVYGLQIARSFMEAHGYKKGLLFTADPYSKILDPDDKNTVLLFGDGAAVTLLEHATPQRPLLAPMHFDVDTHGQQCAALINDDGKLRMNGRQVFIYSATAVPESVRRLLAGAKLALDDIDLFLFHQGSKYIVDAVAKRLEIADAKLARNMLEHGNTVSSTIPILLEPHVKNGAVRRALACGFGVGLSTATCLLERRAG